MLRKGFEASIQLGFGIPRTVIPKNVKEFQADFLAMGAHGYNILKDIILGTTVE